MLILPGHFPAQQPTATPAATESTATGSPTSSPRDSTDGSATPQTTQSARQPTRSPNTGRTRVQPAGVQRAGTRQQLPRRAKSDANALHAPYVPLSSGPDDGTDYMDIDDDVKVTPHKCSPSAEINDPTICCIYCHDVGSYIWTCTVETCGVPVCVKLNPWDHGCIDASADDLTGRSKVTKESFECPRCYRENGTLIPYHVEGYSVRRDFLNRNYFPLLAVFMSWGGFGSPYAANHIRATLEEHYRRDKTRLYIATRTLKAGNHRHSPKAMKPAFEWLGQVNHEGNMLIFVNTHSDTDTGNLVVSGNEANPHSVPIYELLTGYIGDETLKVATKAIASINKGTGAGPCIRGLVICACGATGRLSQSAMMLKCFVERDVFDFVLTFAGVSTLDSVVVPALNRFVENVYVYDKNIWHALEESFGEDRHALNQSPVFLAFAHFHPGSDNVPRRVVEARVLAYSNLDDGRPWGLDIYRCLNAQCQAPAYNMIFHPDGKQWFGQQWLKTKVKYHCLKCNVKHRHIPCPDWIHSAKTQNYGRVWYPWPLTIPQQREIGII